MTTAGIPRHMRAMMAGAGALALAGLALFVWAARNNAPQPIEGAVHVAVTETGCQPMELIVPAGPASFVIRNESKRVLEWEILDGVMVVAERENIAPGFSATAAERLKPGRYDITCGLLTNPRGSLTVTATAESEAARAAPPLREFVGPLSETRVRLIGAGAALERDTQALSDAIAARQTDAARAAYAKARADWARLGTVTPRAADLANRISPQAAVLARAEDDPAFTGFHRIEYGLWKEGGTAGLEPVAQALVTDAREFRARLRTVELGPADIAGDAARLARHLAESQVRQGVNLYSGQDTKEFGAALDAIAGAAQVLEPMIAAASPEVVRQIEAAIDQTRGALTAMEANPDDAARAKVADGFAALAVALDAMNPALGLT